MIYFKKNKKKNLFFKVIIFCRNFLLPFRSNKFFYAAPIKNWQRVYLSIYYFQIKIALCAKYINAVTTFEGINNNGNKEKYIEHDFERRLFRVFCDRKSLYIYKYIVTYTNFSNIFWINFKFSRQMQKKSMKLKFKMTKCCGNYLQHIYGNLGSKYFC